MKNRYEKKGILFYVVIRIQENDIKRYIFIHNATEKT